MKVRYNYLFTCVLISSALCSCSNNDDGAFKSNITTTSEIVLSRGESVCNDGINNFSFSLTNEVAKTYPDENFVISPVSMSISAAMVANAVDEKTQQTICKALYSDNINDVNSLCKKLMQFLPDKSNEAVLLLANSIWHIPHLTPTNDFIKTAAENFYCDVIPLNLSSSDAIHDINNWCRRNTNGYINSAFESLPQSALVACINTLYFNAEWNKKFDKSQTTKQTFHGIKSDETVDMMHNEFMIPYFVDDEFEAISLPYTGTYEMIVSIPRDNKPLSSLVENIDYTSFFESKEKANFAKVKLAMPKFQSKLDIDYKDIFKQLGVNIDVRNLGEFSFNESSYGDFTLNFNQTTTFATDETGSTAASVSSSVIGNTAIAPNATVDFTLDVPFFYLVRNTRTGSIILTGQFVQP